jgi:ethanolamine utilization protein EutA
VVQLTDFSSAEQACAAVEGTAVLAFPGKKSPSYEQITQMAEQILSRKKPPIVLCLQQDMAKALGQAVALRLPREAPILCIDGLRVGEGSYLDIGSPVEGAMPVVIKTLVLSK